MAGSSLNGGKTMWKKDKVLVTSNFSFSHSVFKRLVLQTLKSQDLFGKGLRPRSLHAVNGDIFKETSLGHKFHRLADF